jgi:hypothetical protein
MNRAGPIRRTGPRSLSSAWRRTTASAAHHDPDFTGRRAVSSIAGHTHSINSRTWRAHATDSPSNRERRAPSYADGPLRLSTAWPDGTARIKPTYTVWPPSAIIACPAGQA